MNINISIIVPVYNVRHYLLPCVDSILGQTGMDVECILVDDGSTDGSSPLCDEIAARDGRVRVVHKENGGLSDARNAGLDVARGRYISFVDSDDIVLPGMFESLFDRICRNDVDVVVGNVMLHDEQSGIERAFKPLSSFCSDQEVCTWKNCPHLLKALFNVAACNKLYCREVFAERRFKKGIKFEDVPMWTEIFFSGVRVGCVDKFIYQYNVNRPGSIVTSRDYRGYPAVWACQAEALRTHGLFEDDLKNNFVARIVMKFIQAYNMSSTQSRSEFYVKVQRLFASWGRVGLGSERGMVVSLILYLHYIACRHLPFGVYKNVFCMERIICHPRINMILKQKFH